MVAGMNLFKRKDTREANYYVRFQCRGKHYLWSTKTNDRDLARKRGQDYREKVKAGAYHLVDAMHTRSSSPTFEALFIEYGKLSRPNDATKRRNILSMKQVLAASGMTELDRVDQLTREMALKWQQSGSNSDVSKNSTYRKAKSLFSRDALESMPLTIPIELIRDFLRVKYLKVGENMIELPTAEAIQTALAMLPAGPERNGFLLGIGCGLRSGEMVAARWDWIDGNTLVIGGCPDQFTPKSGKYRAVKINDDVLAQLWREPHSPYICGTYAQRAIQRHLPERLAAYGFTMRTPVQSLRQWHASMIASDPARGLVEASKALGHASYKTTERSYARLMRPAGGVALPVAK